MNHRIEPGQRVVLGKIDPAGSGDFDGKKEAAEANEAILARLDSAQELLYAEGKHRVLVILQGMDTSGKDGTTRYVMRGLDPAGVNIVSFKKPTERELAHDFLWRIHPAVPGNGEITVFNRSHYEDVLVVRVHNLVPKAVWKKRYEQINDFERMLAESGTTILKFFLHISKEEQRERLQSRIDEPAKRWKFQHGDLEERKLWAQYQKAYEEAIERTSTSWAPWYVVPADRKWYRNHVVARTLCETLESLEMKYPEPDLSDVTIT